MERSELLKEVELTQASMRAPSTRQGPLVPITHWGMKVEGLCALSWGYFGNLVVVNDIWMAHVIMNGHYENLCITENSLYAYLPHAGTFRSYLCQIREQDEFLQYPIQNWRPSLLDFKPVLSKWGQQVIQGFRKGLDIFWQGSVRKFRQII